MTEDQELVCLERLQTAVEGLGFRCEMLARDGEHPSLNVVNPEVPAMFDRVCVAPIAGELWFWWIWNRRIAPADAVHLAAREIVRILAVG